jgi:hypothetical protein
MVRTDVGTSLPSVNCSSLVVFACYDASGHAAYTVSSSLHALNIVDAYYAHK